MEYSRFCSGVYCLLPTCVWFLLTRIDILTWYLVVKVYRRVLAWKKNSLFCDNYVQKIEILFCNAYLVFSNIEKVGTSGFRKVGKLYKCRYFPIRKLEKQCLSVLETSIVIIKNLICTGLIFSVF